MWRKSLPVNRRTHFPGKLPLRKLPTSYWSTQAVAWITVNASQFRYEKGSPNRYRTETGAWRTFCNYCGTSLTYEHSSHPDEVDITTASLDHPEDFAPTKDVFADEKLSWVDLTKPR